MFFAYDIGIENAGGGSERIYRRINPLFHDGPFQRDGRIQVGKGCYRGGIGVIVRWYVHSLHGSDRTGAGGGNALLEFAHLGRQRGLITHRGGHTPEQRRNFRTGHREAEDVIDEKQHIATLVTEIFGHGERRKRHPQTHARGLVHLPIDHDGIFHNAGFEHFAVKLRSLAGTLTHASEDRVAFMLGRH